MRDTIERLIKQAHARPLRYVVVTLYADGSQHCHETASAAQAENYAIGERRKIGGTLINRATGAAVSVVAVSVTERSPTNG